MGGRVKMTRKLWQFPPFLGDRKGMALALSNLSMAFLGCPVPGVAMSSRTTQPAEGLAKGIVSFKVITEGKKL